MRLLHLGIIFLVMIVIFAVLFWALTLCGHGLKYNISGGTAQVRLVDALYFSIVTVSSLGYGDIRPLGVAKYLAGLEVLMGLALLSIILAKLTSNRLTYHVRRLFAADAQRRCAELAVACSETARNARRLIRKIGKREQPTPGAAVPPEMQFQFSESISDLATEVSQRIEDLSGYLHDEIRNGDFLAEVPVESIDRVLERSEHVLFEFGQMIASISPETRSIAMSPVARERIVNGASKGVAIAHLIRTNTTYGSHRNRADSLENTATQLKASFFLAIREEGIQPDQSISQTPTMGGN